MREPIRILQVFATLDRGGAEAMIMNLYRSIDRERIQFDFVVKENTREYEHEEEIKRLGGRIYRLPDYRIWNHFRYKKAWNKLLTEHPEWNIIHGHYITPAAVYMKVAKQHNRITIAHSHSTKGILSLKSLLKYLLRIPMKKQADYLAACSRSASDWMFGRNNQNVRMIKNAINLEKYEYDESVRKRMLGQFALSDRFVIGHIGNFTKAKNYPFLLEVFQKVKAENEKAILVLVGKKDNNPEIEQQVHRMGLGDSVIFAGVRSDIPELLQMMDLYLFPSRYEGLPVTLIEAQASGLRCIVSDRVTEEVKVTELVEFLSLEETPQLWADRILHSENVQDRTSGMDRIREAGYDAHQEAKKLVMYYESLLV